MRDIWFISDTHFYHANILKFTGDDGQLIRPGFTSTEDMNERMIHNWNSVVKHGDHVWHLGDFAMGNKTIVERLIKRLNGRKRLTVGNHDMIKEVAPYFDKVAMWRIFKEFNFFCMHVPQRKEIFRKTAFQIHGHIHQNKMEDPAYINVCVEHTDYAPVHLDTILQKIKERS